MEQADRGHRRRQAASAIIIGEPIRRTGCVGAKRLTCCTGSITTRKIEFCRKLVGKVYRVKLDQATGEIRGKIGSKCFCDYGIIKQARWKEIERKGLLIWLRAGERRAVQQRIVIALVRATDIDEFSTCNCYARHATHRIGTGRVWR